MNVIQYGMRRNDMPIIYNEKTREFHLYNQEISYIIKILDNDQPGQLYYGKRLTHREDFSHLFEYAMRDMSPYAFEGNSTFSLENIKQEYPTFGCGDMRFPAYEIERENGSHVVEFVYKEHKIYNGKPKLEGLPATYVESDDEAQTLELVLEDTSINTRIVLLYTIYEAFPVIARSVRFECDSDEKITLLSAMSACVDLPDKDYEMIDLAGVWARERHVRRHKLDYGIQSIYSMRGCSSYQFNPFLALARENADEFQGQVYGFSLVYSGNFLAQTEVDNYDTARVLMGIHPNGFKWTLGKGESFQTPEMVMVYSEAGLNGMSQTFHKLYRTRLARGTWRDKVRPILINSWEAFYFDFDAPKLLGLADAATDLGMELFVLDDGWFGNKYPRKDDHAGLGDWEVTHSKLPGGVPALVKAAKEAGVKFGIWIEPEMVNPKSELFEKHPDWAIHDANRKTYYYRNQLVLDLSNPAVQDYVYGVVENLMKENPEIAFFKWDCNSPITNIYSPYLKDKQGQLYIDHVRGVYNVMKRVKENYPNVPMMLCSGGGARCDYEALKYFTEFWCSDNTDPVERVYIQWGFSQFFPAKAMCAHVTSWNKNTSVKFRTDVASMCKLGFDIGLKDMTADELAYCQDAVANWKRLQPAIMDGDQYRLVSPYETNHMAVNYVSKDQKKAVLFAYDVYPRFQEKLINVKLQGLDPNKMYKVEEINLMPGVKSVLKANGKVLSGDYLMKIGLEVFGFKPLHSCVIELTEQK